MSPDQPHGDDNEVPPSGTWVLVADASRARLFLRQRDRTLVEQQSLVSPEERLPERERVSDRAGRSFDSRGGGRHAMEPRSSSSDESTRRFAAELAQRLEQLCTAGQLDRLVLLAAPKFLGTLRAELNGTVKQRVALEIDKDLARESPDRIARQLPEFF